jgi:hypothetical protein
LSCAVVFAAHGPVVSVADSLELPGKFRVLAFYTVFEVVLGDLGAVFLEGVRNLVLLVRGTSLEFHQSERINKS